VMIGGSSNSKLHRLYENDRTPKDESPKKA
jgi:hypothetical protein